MRGKRKLVIAASVLAAIALALLVLPLAGGIFSSRTWFDTSSGQLHVKRGVLGITYSDEVRDTDFSRMYRRLVGEPAAPQWRFAYGLAHGVLGYGRECGSAPVSDAKLFADLLADDTFTDAARRKILTTFVDLARKREDEKIQWYWRVVFDALDAVKPGAKLDADAVPAVPDKSPFKQAGAPA